MGYETIQYELSDNICTITLNRPDKLNAINGTMQRELDAAMEEAERDDDVRVVILTGAGRAFSAGIDMAESIFPDWRETPFHQTLDAVRRRGEQHLKYFMRFWNFPKPLIASINGHCLGGGFTYAMMCDIRVTSENAYLGEPEIHHFSGPLVMTIPWQVNMVHAKRLLLSGDKIDGREAERIGLVNKATDAESVMEMSLKMAKKLCLIHPLALKLNKLAVNRAYEFMGFSSSQLNNIDMYTQHHGYSLSASDDLWQTRKDKGLKEFLRERDAKFAEYDW